jgi:hypothetical protein
MLRDHLYHWRANHSAKNHQEYLDSISKLPEIDRECASALWGIKNLQDILIILTSFYHLERYRELLKLENKLKIN